MSTKKEVYRMLFKESKTELATQKIELAVGDELKKISSKTEALRKKLDSEIDNAFEPIREIEKAASKIPSSIDGLNQFVKSLQDMEQQYDEDNRKIKAAEKDLGVKIERPKALEAAIKELQKFQEWETEYRKNINEFNRAVKKYK